MNVPKSNEQPVTVLRSSGLVRLPGQPLCKHYTGASLDNLTGDNSCRCLAGIPYDRWVKNMERWPCRRRHILGLEQHHCDAREYGDQLTESVDAQVTDMTERAIGQPNK
jgi:hypothetical protein